MNIFGPTKNDMTMGHVIMGAVLAVIVILTIHHFTSGDEVNLTTTQLEKDCAQMGIVLNNELTVVVDRNQKTCTIIIDDANRTTYVFDSHQVKAWLKGELNNPSQ